jgi:hypothetical protein
MVEKEEYEEFLFYFSGHGSRREVRRVLNNTIHEEAVLFANHTSQDGNYLVFFIIYF